MKAQTKAILASIVVIAVALSAVSGVTYSWWSDSENTDITVGTGNLDVDVKDIVFGDVTDDCSGLFTVDGKTIDSSDKGEKTTSLSLITAISNAAPNDKYYVDYTVTFSTTVYASYMVDVVSNADWVSVTIEPVQTTFVHDGTYTDVSTADLSTWTNLPADNQSVNGKAYAAINSVRVVITIADDAPMNASSNIVITNTITPIII